MIGAVLAALGSALFAAASSVLHHRAGVACAGVAIVIRPVWLVGTVAGLVGVMLHVVALQRGQLSLVQPLLVSGLLFALPLAALLEQRPVRVAQLGWAGVVVLGLALFLTCAQPARGRTHADPGVLALSAGLVLLAATAACAAGTWWRRHRAALWAFAGGCGYGVVAALLKDSVALLDGGVAALLTSWVFGALLVVGAGAIAVNQAAFNAGPLASSLPVLTIVDPVVAVVLGAVVFGEEIASSPVLVVAQVVGSLVMAVGVVALTRPPTDTSTRRRGGGAGIVAPAAGGPLPARRVKVRSRMRR